MAFFLIGRGPEDDLRVLTESFFESRQDAMAELSRISADPEFSQWDTEVFVLDLEQGVPVLLVRPQSAELPMDAAEAVVQTAEQAAEDSGAPEAEVSEEAVESATPIDVEEPLSAEEEAPEPSPQPEDEAEQGDLRDAIQRTTEHMSAEGIVPPASAGLGVADESAVTQTEAPSEDVALEAQTAPEGEAEVATAEPESGADSSWPWAAAPPAPETDTAEVSPDIATVYEALEAEASADLEPEAVAADAAPLEAGEAEGGQDDTDFILDLDAIQPVALDENPAQEGAAEESPLVEETPEPIPAEAAGDDSYSSTLTDYTCEDCVYVETCPNRDQRAPKDCGSFQWK